jgi:hypothetical protein
MKNVLQVIAVLSTCCMVAGALVWVCPATGSPVPDSVAAALHGGCAGVGTNTCSGIDLPCGLTGVGNGSESDNDPSSITAYWCITTVNYETVCATCSANYVSCAH